ncbi:MAG: serine hydrolase domain-containing protein [Candidatus Azotimanducaceae bacterium]|uniref:Class A beta-lactamase-related serine hydrolase n=1 Tax=OM182 bacterium TaxID=2510334 RepID=A0A520S5N1_9GAMM|nr:hypothetical protein [Gammaproteobacteria bacterium]OUV68439.1 MAG: hypothetical protein CBC93_01775 [Gammaproteobacteria bacterium TMED133]RZO77795.1 MAG: class A beta-lactamase-related serine hydrolase [OM182 bacterium]
MSRSQLPKGDPKSLGFNTRRLEQIAPAMHAFVEDKRVPNLLTMVVRKGKVVHLNACGVMDIENSNPANSETLFRLYSNSKPIAGVAALILFEKGILTPDDPVSKFVPQLANLQVQKNDGSTEPSRRDITIRDCLTNTTSLNTPATMPIMFREKYKGALETLGWIQSNRKTPPINSQERMAAISEIPLADHPGKKFVYHVGFPILGAVLEAAAGKDMGQFFKEEIFEPLGMIDSDFYVGDDKLSRFPPCYVPKKIDGRIQLVVEEAVATSEKVIGPTVNFGVGGDMGGVVSTITDYARFGQMLLNGGELEGTRILGRKTVDLMVANHTGNMVIPMTGKGSHFGLGVSVLHGRDAKPVLSSPGTYGWGGAAGTTYFADPSEELMGLCFTQVMQAGAMPNNNYQETFRRMVYQALE